MFKSQILCSYSRCSSFKSSRRVSQLYEMLLLTAYIGNLNTSSQHDIPSSSTERYQMARIKINYTFTDKSIAWEALQLAGNGTTIISRRDMPDGNNRLAMLCDIAIYNFT